MLHKDAADASLAKDPHKGYETMQEVKVKVRGPKPKDGLSRISLYTLSF